MTIQNSINAPTPFEVAKGGTGNSVALTDGQLWIGKTGDIPTPATLTQGTNITITPGAGNITIAATDSTGITWNHQNGGAFSIFPNNAYVNHGPGCLFNFTGSPTNFGDIYICMSSTSATFSVQTSISQPIIYNGASGTALTATSPNAAVSLVCTSFGGSENFSVLSTNGATFTLT